MSKFFKMIILIYNKDLIQYVKLTGPRRLHPSTKAVAAVSLSTTGVPLQTVVPTSISWTYISM